MMQWLVVAADRRKCQLWELVADEMVSRTGDSICVARHCLVLLLLRLVTQILVVLGSLVGIFCTRSVFVQCEQRKHLTSQREAEFVVVTKVHQLLCSEYSRFTHGGRLLLHQPHHTSALYNNLPLLVFALISACSHWQSLRALVTTCLQLRRGARRWREWLFVMMLPPPRHSFSLTCVLYPAFSVLTLYGFVIYLLAFSEGAKPCTFSFSIFSSRIPYFQYILQIPDHPQQYTLFLGYQT